MLSMWLYLLFMLLHCCGSLRAYSVESCPAGVRGLHYFSVAGSHCQFNWTNRAAMIEKVRDRMKHRHKQFLRFKAPVFYLDAAWIWKQAADEFETWIWVAATHEYMLHFPHNFNVLSLGTMGIITNNFWNPGGEGDIFGYCDKGCVKSTMTTPRCALTWKDIQKFMSDVTGDKTEWNYVCLQLDYDVSDVVHNPNSAIPDLLYYSRFLRQLFSKRPFFGKGITKDDFIHYNCFKKNGRLETKELLMNYFVIFLTAAVLWLYSPLLIYYFPSSEPTTINYPAGLQHTEFHPTYKSPVYFGNFLRCLLCFYMEKNKGVKSRVRRLLFVSCLFGVSIRFCYTAYWSFLVFFIPVFLAAALIPDFWSVYLGEQHPTHFLDLWEYPEGVFRKNTREQEYQFLAHCMKERVYLMLDFRFREMLFNESFKSPLFSKTWAELYADFRWSIVLFVPSVCASVVTYICVLLLTMVYYLAPAFYFYKQLFLAIFKGTRFNLLQARRGVNSLGCYGYKALISVASFLYSIVLVAYFMVAMMFACYLVAEVTMFTYIGAVLDPSMAFKYVTLVGAILLVLNKIAKDLRESYDKLRDQVVEILEKSNHLAQLDKACAINRGGTLERKEEPDSTFKILLKTGHQSPKVILYQDHFGTYLSRPLLDFCIEECDPIRRQILFIFVKVFLMTFYLSIAMWIKNVFHKEKEVSSIFTIVQTIAMYFIPNLLQFLAHKSRFGEKDNVVLHRQVHEAMAAFVKKQRT